MHFTVSWMCSRIRRVLQIEEDRQRHFRHRIESQRREVRWNCFEVSANKGALVSTTFRCRKNASMKFDRKSRFDHQIEANRLVCIRRSPKGNVQKISLNDFRCINRRMFDQIQCLDQQEKKFPIPLILILLIERFRFRGKFRRTFMPINALCRWFT